MRKALFTLICLFAMMAVGSGLKAQEITITLNPGWTWISYTNAEAMDISAALGDFVPMSGDMIKAKGAGVAYRNGTWYGGFQQFIPGCGYHYYSNRTEPVSFVFAGTAPQVTVTTTEPTDITATSAAVGGTVSAPEGTHVFLRGVCWGTEPNPDIDGNNTSDGTGIGSFNSTLEGLTSGLTYYVRAYAVTDYGLAYGNEVSFATEAGGSGDHEYVDLGLPSGTLWATCNVGADTPEDYGDYFAWGETTPKTIYNWNNYLYGNGSTFTKYTGSDNLFILQLGDDAATANWGVDWRMPTKEKWLELYNNTTCTWTMQNGVNGRLFTASNGNSLFLPAAGNRSNDELYNAGSSCSYWSSSLSTDYPYFAWYFYCSPGSFGIYDEGYRFEGQSVRAVRSSGQGTSFIINTTANIAEGGEVSGGGTYQEGSGCTLTATANEGFVFIYWKENDEIVSTDATYFFVVTQARSLVAHFIDPTVHSFVDLGLPSGTLWADCNVGANYPEELGDFFAWGETQPKYYYHENTYQYDSGNGGLTKYCNNSYYGYYGYTDNLTILLSEDDAAMANFGSDWRMPTKEEWQELYNNTTHVMTTQNGVYGRLFTASNGNSLFLPAAGYKYKQLLYYSGSDGMYWSSSLNTDNPLSAWSFEFDSGNYGMSHSTRYNGLSVRAVRSSVQNNTPTGAIDGKFTINDNGDQVYFSQGNLQYIGSAATPYWKFADNQWDVLGTTTGQNSSDQNVDRDLFGWGTSGYNHGANCYQPWSISTLKSDYYAYGSATYNLYDQTGQADWGYNPINNGGNQPNQWRTLTYEEWAYVFNSRTTSSGIRYAKAIVNNVNGVILLPDDWSTSYYTLSNTNSTGTNFSNNTITATEWNSLEQQGAIFLPAGGNREGTTVNNVDSNGNYWAASLRKNSYARMIYFSDIGLNADDYYNYRYYGFSVRVVCSVQ